MTEGFFEDIEGRIRDGENIEDILEEIADKVDNDELKNDVRSNFNAYFRRLRRNPNRIYNLENEVEALFDRGLQELGSSSDEFSEYMRESVKENEDLADALEELIFSWRFFLTFIHIYQEEPPPEYRRPILDQFGRAYEEDPERVNEILDEQIQWRKFLYGFKKSMSRTDKRGKSKNQLLIDKIKIVENLFESVYEPTMYFIGKLISVETGYSTNMNTTAMRQRIETSNLGKSQFWDDEAKHMRNSSSHNTYDVFDDQVTMIDRGWKRTFSEEDLDEKISKLGEVSKNSLYSLSEGYVKFVFKF